MRKFVKVSVVMALLPLVGCMGPYKQEKWEEVKANETAFVIPLEGDTGKQGKFQSVEFLEAAKVAAKRIPIPQRQHDLGRTVGHYEWVPTVVVIKVDRSPVTREWTHRKESGTSPKNQAIAVESLDSINFQIGAIISCSIREEDTAKFLYYFAGKSIEEIIDTTVRGHVQSILAREFGATLLSQCPAKKKEFFKVAFDEVLSFFSQKGLTVDYLGSSEGLFFENEKIQEQFDRQFIGENEAKIAGLEKIAQDKRNETMIAKAKAEAQADIERAQQQALAQEVKNKMLVEKAKAERLAAEETAKAKEGLMVQNDLEIRRIQAEAMKEFAGKWQGSVPAYLPPNSQFFIGFDGLLPKPVVAVNANGASQPKK